MKEKKDYICGLRKIEHTGMPKTLKCYVKNCMSVFYRDIFSIVYICDSAEVFLCADERLRKTGRKNPGE